MLALSSAVHEIDSRNLLEFHVKRRSCLTLLDRYPFQPINFLTLIGWTFFCLCIIH